MNYKDFLQTKKIQDNKCGIDIDDSKINQMLFPFQKAIVRWALQRGRAALFADCGLGKTPCQLEWAQHIFENTNESILILAPLAVSEQTVREGKKFGIDVNLCRSQDDISLGINITNYEMLHKFDPASFGGLVLDESSILKSFTGKVRKQIIEFSSGIKYRLACTATPAPNDYIEIINHAEFLGVMRGKEIIALFFSQDGNTTHNWKLKGHAYNDFWLWLATWSVAMNRPSDLGYDDNGFILPELNIINHKVDSNIIEDGFLFPVEAVTLQERLQARRGSVGIRSAAAAELVNNSDEQWIVWCNLNNESHELKKSISGAVEIKGSDSIDHKRNSLLDFATGKIRVLVTKPLIAGFGMNFQNCHNMAFVGLSDSYEQFYQAMRRCWRFGQQHEVDVHIVTAEVEGRVKSNIMRKEKNAKEMIENIIMFTDKSLFPKTDKTRRNEMEYTTDSFEADNFKIILGDCIEEMDKVEDNSCGLSIFSPPFPGMYAYTNSTRDIGNSIEIDEMIKHFKYVIVNDKLMRILMPGRYACVHLMQLTAMNTRDGYIGLKDYRGRVIDMFIDAGWIYAGEVTIDKNPQIQATRNKERGLLFKTLSKDSSKLRMALADYLIYFRKPGENVTPIRAGISNRYDNAQGWITEEEWIEWAAPVWYRQSKNYPGGIRETDVLNVRCARENDDERHLCPLQLGVIERAVKLWSAPGETVFSPFAGIGSEGYQSILLNRKFIGIELKRSYYEQAIRNLKTAESLSKQQINEFVFE